MGNCNKKDEAVTVTNFDQDKWSMNKSTIHPLCYVLKNYYHPNVKLFKWIATHPNSKPTKISEWRNNKKCQYLVAVYEAGETRCPADRSEPAGENKEQKRPYIVTEQFVRLKDLVLSENQAIVIAYKALTAYREMMGELGGFVARQNMIYINREGIIKVWVNENLADNSLQHPYPTITQSQFITSLLHQIFTRCTPAPEPQNTKVYDYIRMGPISFEEVLSKLGYYVLQRELPSLIGITKEVFDGMIEGYEVREEKKGKKDKSNIKNQQENSINKLKFLVASDQGAGHSTKNYVKDYSQKNIAQPSPPPLLEQSYQYYPKISRIGNNSSLGTMMPHALEMGNSQYRMNNSYVLVNQSFTM